MNTNMLILREMLELLEKVEKLRGDLTGEIDMRAQARMDEIERDVNWAMRNTRQWLLTIETQKYNETMEAKK